MPIRLGIICPSEIAFRRFMPALSKDSRFQFCGIAHSSAEEWGTDDPAVIEGEKAKAQKFIDQYGGKMFSSYSEIASSDEIDALYLPLPPALHSKWADVAVKNGKHCFVEKPFATTLAEAENTVGSASAAGLALHENYMFIYHSQLEFIRNEIKNRKMGDVRQMRICFGFPFRGQRDFRYNKALGGGALLDCGGYTLRLASLLLDGDASVKYASLSGKEGCEVDIFGTAVIENSSGLTVNVSFGMDNAYKCSLEVWGTERTLLADRILTAPAGFEPSLFYTDNNGTEEIKLPADDTFSSSVSRFYDCINDPCCREDNYKAILGQARLVEEFRNKAAR